ncbi:hypothetical protein Cantr_05047 [Candida viswanathii]|uniref:Uncharacterized protein n=1 Tax=Candida viswanathii TaxID=5486 RepID=A0A367XSG5_9ASCO|nr:hypothetical protein Cantr_05047 [Candida viswanathii]
MQLAYDRQGHSLENEIKDIRLQQREKELLQKEQEIYQKEREICEYQEQLKRREEAQRMMEAQHEDTILHNEISFGASREPSPTYSNEKRQIEDVSDADRFKYNDSSGTSLVVRNSDTVMEPAPGTFKEQIQKEISVCEKKKSNRFAQLASESARIENAKQATLHDFDEKTQSLGPEIAQQSEFLRFISSRATTRADLVRYYDAKSRVALSEATRDLEELEARIKDLTNTRRYPPATRDLVKAQPHDAFFEPPQRRIEMLGGPQQALMAPHKQDREKCNDKLIGFTNPALMSARPTALDAAFNTKRQKVSSNPFQFPPFGH